jgi:hypothetical protein
MLPSALQMILREKMKERFRLLYPKTVWVFNRYDC